jgi:hypothetical protein
MLYSENFGESKRRMLRLSLGIPKRMRCCLIEPHIGALSKTLQPVRASWQLGCKGNEASLPPGKTWRPVRHASVLQSLAIPTSSLTVNKTDTERTHSCGTDYLILKFYLREHWDRPNQTVPVSSMAAQLQPAYGLHQSATMKLMTKSPASLLTLR